MKKVILFILFFRAFTAEAQKPETIYSFIRVQKPLDWYKKQQNLWKSELERSQKNGNAWFNYYRVSRNLNRCDTTDRRPMEEKQKDLSQLVNSMGKAIPNSYEFNLCKWMEGGNNPIYLPYLKKAIALGEGRSEHLPDVVIMAETERNIPDRDAACQKWKATKEVSAGMLYYNYNVLNGLPNNAILFTAGDNDTFPCWILQSQGIRRDVTVINISLLRLDNYRSKLFEELGIAPYAIPKDAEGNLEQLDSERFDKEIIRHCSKNTKSHPVCVSLTTSSASECIAQIESNLYLTGLAYEFRLEPMDNMAILKRNFIQNYALDYLDKPFYDDISQGLVKEMNRNYLIPMLKLYDHFQISGELAAQNQLKNKILAVAQGTKEEKQVLELLNKTN